MDPAAGGPPVGPAEYPEHVVHTVWDDLSRPCEWIGGLRPAVAYAPPHSHGPVAEPYLARLDPLYRSMRRGGAGMHEASFACVLEFIRAREEFPSLGRAEDVLLGVYSRREGERALSVFLRAPNSHGEQLQVSSRDDAVARVRAAWERRHGLR